MCVRDSYTTLETMEVAPSIMSTSKTQLNLLCLCYSVFSAGTKEEGRAHQKGEGAGSFIMRLRPSCERIAEKYVAAYLIPALRFRAV